MEVQVRVNSTGSSDDVRVNTGSSDITGVPETGSHVYDNTTNRDSCFKSYNYPQHCIDSQLRDQLVVDDM